jgi:hypothetical protein
MPTFAPMARRDLRLAEFHERIAFLLRLGHVSPVDLVREFGGEPFPCEVESHLEALAKAIRAHLYGPREADE